MKEDSYKKLFDQYNIAVAKSRDLQEQLSKKEEQWEARDREFDVTKKLARELCEMILAKDSEQMVLGKKHTWDSKPLNDLINDAKNTFKAYCASRTELMKRLADLAEERREEIEDLNDIITRFKTIAGGGTEVSVEEIEKSIKKEKEKADTSMLSPEAQIAAENGDVNYYEADNLEKKREKAKNFKKALKEGKAVVAYEDYDEMTTSDTEKELHKKNMEDNVKAKVTPKSIKSVHTEKEQKKKKKQRFDASLEVHKEYLDKMSDISDAQKLMLQTIGETKKSISKEIVGEFIDRSSTIGKTASVSFAEATIIGLKNADALERLVINTPFIPKLALVRFTDKGAILYKKLFGQLPDIGEWERIENEHSNPTHGYGIVQCAEEIKKLKIFKEIKIYNRKNPVYIQSESEMKYVPDIWCIDENGQNTYIEYECDHYEQPRFNARCNKIALVTDRLNCLVPNTDILADIMDKYRKWVESRGKSKLLNSTVIRVGTAKSISGMDLRKDENWLYTYAIGKDTDFVKNL